MSRRLLSKYRESSSRTPSASRDSEIVVKPTRSANRTETSRRSATGAIGAGGSPAGATSTASRASGEPHSPQNLAPGEFATPQDGQATASGLPHSAQNFRPGSFSVAQLGQSIVLLKSLLPRLAPDPQRVVSETEIIAVVAAGFGSERSRRRSIA